MRALNDSETILVQGAVCPCQQGKANAEAEKAIEAAAEIIYFVLPSMLITAFWLL